MGVQALQGVAGGGGCIVDEHCSMHCCLGAPLEGVVGLLMVVEVGKEVGLQDGPLDPLLVVLQSLAR